MDVTAIAVAVSGAVGSASPPFTGHFRFKIEVGSLLAPATAITVLAAVRAGILDRLRWPLLVAVG